MPHISQIKQATHSTGWCWVPLTSRIITQLQPSGLQHLARLFHKLLCLPLSRLMPMHKPSLSPFCSRTSLSRDCTVASQLRLPYLLLLRLPTSHNPMIRCLLRYLPVSLLFHSEHPDVLGHDCQHNASSLSWHGLQIYTLVINLPHWSQRQ